MRTLPDKDQILAWISENPTKTSKRDIARAFGIKGAARIDLKRLLKELESEGHLLKQRKTYRDPDRLPPVSVLQVLPADGDGDLFARPLEWAGNGPEPVILFLPRAGEPSLAEGDRILARLQEVTDQDHSHVARLIRKIGANPVRILGIFRQSAEGGRILPIDKKSDKEWVVAADATQGAKDGELVEGERASSAARMGLPRARVTARLGDPTAPRAVSLIAIHQHGIPDAFPDEAMAEADEATPAELGQREDLRNIDLITVDPSDARDRDDAIFAAPDPDPKNDGGFVIWVAIADVAHYVTPGGALDKEARHRGNSTYFPDRVVPMLPDILSGDLCSLHEHVDRPCMAVRMRINAIGEKIDHRFSRGLMRSRASLTYQEFQAARDGQPSERCAPLLDTVISPLFAAYEALKKERAARQPLNLDLPEREIRLGDDGQVQSIRFKERLDAHRLIEEFMILANVAAAEELTALRRPLLFRVHEEPSPEKLDGLREVAQSAGLVLAKGQVLKTAHLNGLLAKAQETDFAELINLSTLRAMTQAYYRPQNFGHFGLALRSYAHFTSPIRRYSDLIVHRALIAGHGWGDDGQTPQEAEDMASIGTQVSETERRSMLAERDTVDRYLAAFLNERIGNEFTGRISGVARFGLFIKLDETGADGLVPVREIGREYFHFDADTQTLMGAETGTRYGLGQRVTVRLAEAAPITGGLILDLLNVEGKTVPIGPKGRSRRPSKGRSKRVSRKKGRVSGKSRR